MALIDRYKCDENTGGTTTSDNGNVLTFTGAGVTWGAGLSPVSGNVSSIVTDGTDYAAGSDVGLPSGNAARSVAIWIKTTATGYAYFVCYGTSAGGQGFAIGVDPSGNAIFSDLGMAIASSVLVNDGNPHLLVVTHDGITIRVYVDAVLVASGSDTLGTVLGTLYLGNGNVGVSAGPIAATLDDPQFYNSALTLAQITQLYATGAPVSDGGINKARIFTGF